MVRRWNRLRRRSDKQRLGLLVSLLVRVQHAPVGGGLVGELRGRVLLPGPMRVHDAARLGGAHRRQRVGVSKPGLSPKRLLGRQRRQPLRRRRRRTQAARRKRRTRRRQQCGHRRGRSQRGRGRVLSRRRPGVLLVLPIRKEAGAPARQSGRGKRNRTLVFAVVRSSSSKRRGWGGRHGGSRNSLGRAGSCRPRSPPCGGVFFFFFFFFGPLLGERGSSRSESGVCHDCDRGTVCPASRCWKSNDAATATTSR
mmetsp:Transcript_26938/g.54240  ORF Transcript_26938/g.54240 Transcript_26938/m.54240 type:complete len:253 (+) Transcript_26938:348-1106(+)